MGEEETPQKKGNRKKKDGKKKKEKQAKLEYEGQSAPRGDCSGGLENNDSERRKGER